MRVAGAMSGTSLDGVDLAVIETDGVAVTGFGETRYRPYSEPERAVLRAALGRWPGEAGVRDAARVVEEAHLELLAGLDTVAVFGFHGQTLAHDPGGGRTHQAGDGARIATQAGVTTVWDFRSNDMQLGGQGAPLAPFYHWALARHIGAVRPIAFLNLGGVGNITLVDPRIDRPEAPGACLAFDTGPANAPIDDLMRARRGRACDRDGGADAGGRVDAETVAVFFSMTSTFRKMRPSPLEPRRVSAACGLGRGHGRCRMRLATLAACLRRRRGARRWRHPAGRDRAPPRHRRRGAAIRGLMEMLAVATDRPVCAALEEVGL